MIMFINWTAFALFADFLEIKSPPLRGAKFGVSPLLWINRNYLFYRKDFHKMMILIRLRRAAATLNT